MSVTQTARFPDDLHAALKTFCDRINSNANAEIIIAVRKHVGLPTFEERIEWMEEQISEISDRLKILEQANAIATPQSVQPDIQSSAGDLICVISILLRHYYHAKINKFFML